MLANLLATGRTLLADGATGTNLFAMGLTSGDAPEMWNLEHPDRVRALHQGFVDAGSDIILTNSFGGNARRLWCTACRTACERSIGARPSSRDPSRTRLDVPSWSQAQSDRPATCSSRSAC